MNKIFSHLTIVFSLMFMVACGDNQEDASADAKRHQQAALAYQQQGQFRAALLEARSAVQLQPDNAAAYVILAQIYNQVGAHNSTQSLLEGVVEDIPLTSMELAEAYIATKKFRSALNTLGAYTPASGAEKIRHLHMQGLAYTALGDKEGFEKVIKELDAQENADAVKQYLLATNLVSQGKSEEAQALLEQAITEFPDHVDSLILLGEIFLYSNQLEQSEKYLTQALALRPSGDVMTTDRARILTQLTQALIQQGRTSEAYTYQKLLAEANPESQVVQQKFADAMELYQQEKFAEAEVLLKEIHEQFPRDENTGTLLGLIQYQQGDDQEAVDLFDQFVDPETANPTVIQAAAVAKYRTNKIDEAVALLKSAAENQPNNATILATYGLALLDRDETSNEGALALEKSLALYPAQQRLRIALAKRYVALKKNEQALAQLQKAYKEQPLDLVIQQSYFKALLTEGLDQQVQAEIIDFKNTYPDNARGHFLEGWYQIQHKKYKAAQAAFEKSLSQSGNKEKQLSYSGLAQAYAMDDRPQEAANTWQMALREDPTLVMGYRSWLGIMHKLNKIPDAVAFLKELEARDTRPWQPSVALAQIHFGQRQVENAIQHIEIARDRSNDNETVKLLAANLYNDHGLELRRKNEPEKARVSMLKALELFPDNVTYIANLIETELNLNRFSEAQKLLDQFPKDDKNTAAVLFLQGAIHRANGQPENALKFYRQSWDAKPTDNSAEAIYNFYLQAEQAENANEMVDQWLEKLPLSPRPTLIKAIDAQQQKAESEAVIWYEKTIELAPNSAAALNNLAWLYYEQKDPRALEFGKRAYDLAPNSPPILDTYGWILVEQGRVKEGIGYLQKAAERAPDSKEIQQHLKEAEARLNQ